MLRPRVLRPACPTSYELFLQREEIEHRATRVKRAQFNGIVERFHRTLLDEHFRVEGRRTWFETIEEMQAVLDDFLAGLQSAPAQSGPQHERPHAREGIRRRPA